MKKTVFISGVGEIEIRRGDNIRRLSLRMAPGKGIWMNVPRGVSLREAEDFARTQKEWLVGNLQRLKERELKSAMKWNPGEVIQTKFHCLHLVLTDEESPRYTLSGRDITFYIPRHHDRGKVIPAMERILTEVYRLESREYLPGRLQELATRHGFRYGRLSFRDNVSRWGSCSATDNISLNVQLMKLPEDLIDYVLLHELCHTVEKNHSPRFWALLEKVCPGCLQARQRLRQYHTRM